MISQNTPTQGAGADEAFGREKTVPLATVRDDAELLDAEAACRLLRVHRNTLYRLIRTDGVPALRLTRGGRWRFPKRDLLDWLESRQARRVR